jgi:predicted membrane protein
MFAWIMFIAICVLAIAYLSGRFTANYAAQVGRSRRAWFVWGAVFFPLFPLPWMVLGVLPRR